MRELSLQIGTGDAWAECIVDNFDEFILDHAANERKASTMAMTLVAHYPDRKPLMEAMIELALEELNHFRQVVKIIHQRGLMITSDEKDPYVNQLRGFVRGGSDDYFLDRLLSAAVIEARGAERFSILAETLADPKLKAFYTTLAQSENKHHCLFLDIAHSYFPEQTVDQRLLEWLQIEKNVIEQLPIHPRLH
tara:strand:+ start:802 stop:1380 length:579 start_codon:yes stop_codon:yes gene_type:complete